MTIPEPFVSRIARLRALLDESESELLLADHGELMAWITGYTVSETMYRAVLVGRDAPPWMVLRDLDAPQVSGQGWLADVEGFADRDDPFAAVAASIRRRGFAAARIVVDSASYSFTVDAQSRLRAELPAAEFMYRPGVSDRLRAVKDDAEIDLLRRAADIADRSMERLRAGIGPDVTVRQAGALAASSYLELGADDGQVGRICLGAGATGFLHAELDDRPLQAGDVLHAELVPRVKRYSARIMRPIAVVAPDGQAPAAVRTLVERLVFHQDRQIAAMTAGAKAADVDAVLRDALVGEGIRERYDNVTGYMLGIYGRTPRSSDFSHTFLPTSDWPLQAGMVFHMYTSAEGVGISETVLVTAGGGERLTRTPRCLLVGGTALQSEEVQDGHQDPEGRDRSGAHAVGATEEGAGAMSESEFELVEGSGNVFRDFSEPDADLKQAKAIIAARIIAVLDERGLTVRKAGEVTGFAAADFSRIRDASLGRFTLDRLMKILAALDGRIRVTVRVDPRRTGTAAAPLPG